MTSDAEKDHRHAHQALDQMLAHGISPDPDNYAVWFSYSARRNPELVREIDTLVIQKIPFSKESCAYLYNKYIVGDRQQKVLDEAAVASQKVLLEVLRAITDFSDETKSYNKDVDQYLESISEKFEETGLQDIVRELISATTDLRKNGEKINSKLEESTREIQHLRKNLQKVTTEAQRDFLTGLFNRKTFEKLVDEQLMLAREQKHDLCLMMMDIDHFKQFNDRFGHLLGDEVLKIVARTLTDTLKGRDVVARFGGEEFIVILPDTPVEGAMKVAETIRAAIAGKELKRRDTGENFGVITISIGVARFRPDSDILPTLIKRADEALYSSKHHGRNRVTCEG